MSVSKPSKHFLDTLANFDNLPDSASVRLPVLQSLYACSSSSIWRGVRAGRIPKPRKLSPRTTCWNVGELRANLKSLDEINNS